MFHRYGLVSLKSFMVRFVELCELYQVRARAGGSYMCCKLPKVLFCAFVMFLFAAGTFVSPCLSQTLNKQNPAQSPARSSASDVNTPAAPQAIARFDVVPFQVFSGTFEIGVVAFHLDGIQKVDFEYETLTGPRTITETTMRLNPRTGVCEYWTTLNASEFSDGPVKIKATAYPNNGLARELPLELYANAHNTLAGRQTLYVSQNGDDATGAGSRDKPFRSIQKAFTVAAQNVAQYDGGEIVLMNPGSYDMQGVRVPADNKMWITIRPDEGLLRNDVVITSATREPIRISISRLRFYNLSFDFSKIGQIYKEDAYWQWFDHCRWYQSEGWTATYPGQNWSVRNAGFNGLYVTDSIAEEMLYGFTGCNLVRNSQCRKISGDAFQMSRMVVNCTAENIGGTSLEHHSDLFQFWDQNENIIVYGVKAANVAGAQNFFFGGLEGTYYVNCAFVNIAVQNNQKRMAPPFSQFHRMHDHVLFMHISNPGQLSIFADDGDKDYTARNVKYVNCIIERLLRGTWGVPGVPNGVTVESCHFLQGQLHGTKATTGEISIVDGPGSRFSYAGAGVPSITGSGQVIPGFSHPNNGAAEHDAPNRGAFVFDVNMPGTDPNAK